MSAPILNLWLFTACMLSIAGDAVAARGFSREVDRLVRPYVETKRTYALSIGVLREGRAFLRGYGRFSEDDEREPDGDTIYEIASLSKVFTGVLLAESVVRGDVRLDQPAQKLLPSGVRMPSKGPRPITLLDLATHVSGLPRQPSNLPNRNGDNIYRGYTEDMLYEFLNNHELRREPGVEYEYSNLAAGLLGVQLASRANLSFEELLRSRITKPLRMSETSIEVSDRNRADLAPPHRADLAPAEPWNRDTLHGAGAILSSARDLLRFAEASMRPPRKRIGMALDIAWRQHRPPVKGTNYGMGLGWFISSDGHTRYHTGSTGGYRSAIDVSRERGVAVVVLANSKGLEAGDLCTELYRMAIGREVPTRDYPPLPEVPPETLRRLVGRYQAKKAVYNVSLDGEKLMVRYGRQKTYRVFPITPTHWEYRNFDATLTFQENEEGVFSSLEMIKPNYASTAQRIEQEAE